MLCCIWSVRSYLNSPAGILAFPFCTSPQPAYLFWQNLHRCIGPSGEPIQPTFGGRTKMNSTFHKFCACCSWAISLNFRLVRWQSVDYCTAADTDEMVPALWRDYVRQVVNPLCIRMLWSMDVYGWSSLCTLREWEMS